jgi:hypothetical protein
MKSVKQTITNWISENQRAAFIIAGAVGLPLLLAIGGGLLALVANIFMWFGLSTAASLLITSLMVIGAIGGLVAYSWLDDND